jgi:lipopolysaccharide export LptBFGC system permease protein LptF
MRILDRYVLRTLLPFAIICLAGIVMLFVVIDGFSYMHNIAQQAGAVEGFWGKLAAYYAARSAGELIRFGAAASLMATAMAVYSLGKTGELTAVRASGTGLRRAMAPIAAFGAAMAAMGIAASLLWTPALTEIKNSGNAMLMRYMPPARSIERYREPDGREIIFSAEGVDSGGRTMRDISILEIPPDDAAPSYIEAQSASWDAAAGAWMLRSGDGPGSRRSLATDQVRIAPDAAQLLEAAPADAAEAARLWETARDLPPFQARPPERLSVFKTALTPARLRCLMADDDQLETAELIASMDIPRAAVEFHQRIAVPWAHFLVVLWGIPLMARWGGRNPIYGAAGALAVGLLFFASTLAGAALAEETGVPAWAAIWTPVAAFTLAGAWTYGKMDD